MAFPPRDRDEGRAQHTLSLIMVFARRPFLAFVPYPDTIRKCPIPLALATRNTHFSLVQGSRTPNSLPHAPPKATIFPTPRGLRLFTLTKEGPATLASSAHTLAE
jgi:hypothetical protein